MAQPSTSTLQQQSTLSPYTTNTHHTLLTSGGSGTAPTNNNLPSLDSTIYSSLELGTSLCNSNDTANDIEQSPSQKITLLTRPSNPVPSQGALSTSPLANCFEDSVLSRMMLGSADTSPISRPRDYYFDTEDPSVNLHDFIINSLQAPKNRVILLQLEDEFLKYVSDPKRTEPLKLPSWDSYHRMLAHRVAAYFGLEHNVDPHDKTRVVVLKGPSTRLPQQRFSDHIPAAVYEESEINEPKLILKRIRASSGSEKFDGITNTGAATATEIKTFEEREEEYEKARARIFSQSSTQLHISNDDTPTSIPFDLFSSSPFSSQNALRTPLHHRRTFSDTAFINKLFSQKEVKPIGPSSSGNSPSSTPAAFFPPSPPSVLSDSSPSSNIINQSTNSATTEEPQLVPRQKRLLVTSRSQPPSFMPLYGTTPTSPPVGGASLPIVYHPQPTAIIDPGWYYNNAHHMVLYPVAPPQTNNTYPIPHIAPVLPPHYSLQHPAGNTVRHMGGVRVPAGHVIPEHLASPPGSVVYRPLPQQGVQLKSEEFPSNGAPPPIWNPQVPHIPTPPTVYQPPQYTANHLAEQMEKDLTITDNIDTNDTPDKLMGGAVGGALPPVGHRQPMYLPNLYGRPGGSNHMYGYPMEPIVLSPTTLVTSPPQYIPGHHEPRPPSFPPPPAANLSLHHHQESPTSIPPHHNVLQPHAIQSPIQILGHTLSTSILSPPPSAGPPGLFMNPTTNTVKPNSPGLSAVGSSLRFQRFDTPKQVRTDIHSSPFPPPLSSSLQQADGSNNNNITSYKSAVMSDNTSGGGQVLPPRLAQRGGGSSGGTRYQNQRHPSNRSTIKPDPVLPSTNTYTSYTANNTSVGNYGAGPHRREPLLPTPSEMIKLDTGITAGVPVHIMEVLNPHNDDTQEYHQMILRLKEHGALEFKKGWINRHTELMVAIFDSSDTALQALKQCVLPPPSKLSIPLPTHAKHILQIL